MLVDLTHPSLHVVEQLLVRNVVDHGGTAVDEFVSAPPAQASGM